MKVTNYESLKAILTGYCNDKFPDLLSRLNEEETTKFLNELALPIFAHRSKKGLEYLAGFKGEDFTIVRDVCEGYSNRHRSNYFAKPTLAFAFIWFTHESQEGKDFATKKFQG